MRNEYQDPLKSGSFLFRTGTKVTDTRLFSGIYADDGGQYAWSSSVVRWDTYPDHHSPLPLWSGLRTDIWQRQLWRCQLFLELKLDLRVEWR